jgi:hypothetical protein
LALQVAGHLLATEYSYGFGVKELLAELRDGARILAAQSPASRPGLLGETSLTVAALLHKSTDRLDPLARECFAYLGVMAPKPATFDLAAMEAMWLIENAQDVLHRLLDLGLLERVPETNRYQMHALLVSHAKSFLELGGSPPAS